jgi:hypothetical protein
MKIRLRWLAAYLVALALVGAVGTFWSFSTSSGGGTGTGDLADVVGVWNGTWTDTVFHVSGPATCTIAKSGDSYTASGTIGLASIGFGLVGGTAAGTADGSTLSFTFSAAGFGSGSGALAGSEGSGSGTVGAFGPFTFSGTVSGNTMSGTFT